MDRQWRFGQKVGLGFSVMVLLALLLGAIGVTALRGVVASKDRVLAVNAQNLIDAQRMFAEGSSKRAAIRGFLFTRDERFVDAMNASRAAFRAVVERLRGRVVTDEGRRLLAFIERAEEEHQETVNRLVAKRRSDATVEALTQQFEAEVLPKREVVDRQIAEFVVREERLLDDAQRASSEVAQAAITQLVVVAASAVIVAIAVALVLTRTLTRQLGQAAMHVQTASAELQTTSSEQATAGRQQATAMSEIGTTVSELLATSRQIAESAQRVTHNAEVTAGAAGNGVLTVQRAQESIASIKRQVDAVVAHMLDLGNKSQQIGAILELINELTEQTNILAINATIEAAGAGEAGRRFGVVADEVRKLADRVGGSTKDIRSLIDEIRASVNTTVMATEGGSKAADAGTRQFAEASAVFAQIADMVDKTTDAAREIELSTKQQASAVEQVKVAISDVLQSTKETEIGLGQTLKATSELSRLSRELLSLVASQQAE